MDHGVSDLSSVHFGQTTVSVVVGDLARQPVQGVIVSSNSRGMMSSASAGGVRMVCGGDVERLAMALAPLSVGRCIATASGDLAGRGIDRVLHAVVVDRPGARAREADVLMALASALALADTERVRSIALPLLGLNPQASQDDRQQHTIGIVQTIVAHLRRSPRLQQVRLVTQDENDAAIVQNALRVARERLWSVR